MSSEISSVRPKLAIIYWRLMKPRVVVLLQITAVCAIIIHDLLSDTPFDLLENLLTIIVIVIGGTLSAGGSNAINMWYERDSDALMERTSKRPLPMGWIGPTHALLFGITVAILGCITVSLPVRGVWAWKAGFWCFFSVMFYVFIYTILLKRRTTQNIVIGGLAGSTPPLIGWAAAASNQIHLANEYDFFNLGSSIPWMLFLLIFLWTPPHFWALALFRSEEYHKVGIPMLPSVKGFKRTLIEMKIYSILLIFLAAIPLIWPQYGIDWSYSIVTVILGVWYYRSISLIDTEESLDDKGRLPSALKSFLRSLKYLAAMFSTLVLIAAIQSPIISLIVLTVCSGLMWLFTARFMSAP